MAAVRGAKYGGIYGDVIIVATLAVKRGYSYAMYRVRYILDILLIYICVVLIYDTFRMYE